MLIRSNAKKICFQINLYLVRKKKIIIINTELHFPKYVGTNQHNIVKLII